MRILDRILLGLVARRLARFRQLGDGADRFADRIAETLGAEIARRNELLHGWDAELKTAKATAAAARRAREAVERFQSFEPGNRLRLQ